MINPATTEDTEGSLVKGRTLTIDEWQAGVSLYYVYSHFNMLYI